MIMKIKKFFSAIGNSLRFRRAMRTIVLKRHRKDYFLEMIRRRRECRDNSRARFDKSFDMIFADNHWGSRESASGGGSDAGRTRAIREYIPRVIRKYGIGSILDVPCGDYNWMKLVDKSAPAGGGAKIDYIGGDVVGPMIEKNNALYKGDRVSFRVIDITKDELPKVDLIFCKDCLQHLSEKNVLKALDNFKKSGAKYLLLTSYPLTIKNWDINDGDYRPLNLFLPPFNMKDYIDKMQEVPDAPYVEWDKMMFLYKL